MYLNKPGNNYNGVDHKYYSKRSAVDRLETFCYDWFFKYRCERFYKLKNELSSRPFYWRDRYFKAIDRVRNWVSTMAVETDDNVYEYQCSRDEGEYTLQALELAIDEFITEAEKLISITLEYNKLKPKDKKTYNRAIGIIDFWVNTMDSDGEFIVCQNKLIEL